MSGYFKEFKVKDGDKGKNNNVFPSRRLKAVKKYENIWTTIENFKKLVLPLPVFEGR